MSALVNALKIPELRKRIAFTAAMLVVLALGNTIPVPGVDSLRLAEYFRSEQATGSLLGLANLFSGGALSQMSVFALGIMPYISASIILQLLIAVVPSLEQMVKEGELGRRKITQYTRYGTVVLSLIQGMMLAVSLEHPNTVFPGAGMLVLEPGMKFRLMTALTLCTGSVFLMWIGEQITERGVGNGISLIIFCNIVSRLPLAIGALGEELRPGGALSESRYLLVVIVALMLFVIAAIVVLTQAQRRIPVQHAKRIVGRKVYGSQTTYLPLRVNQAGVIPIIFASSILLFPATIAQLSGIDWLVEFIQDYLGRQSWLYNTLYALGIIFFTYFYTAITFNTKDIAESMKKYGNFIPGIRPGKATEEYLDRIMTRITFAGALALAAIALLPTMVGQYFRVPWVVSSFFGGTSMIIVVGVALDTVKQLEAHLLMRHYEGFVKKGRIRGRR